jgi:hypothetical protein
MAQLVTSGLRLMMCSFAWHRPPSTFLPVKMITAGGPVANIQDHIP